MGIISARGDEELIQQAISDTKITGTILSAAETSDTVAIVEQRGEERWYHAIEYSRTGDLSSEWLEIVGGYSTKEKHHYMGERYRDPSLWGEYFTEVFYHPPKEE